MGRCARCNCNVCSHYDCAVSKPTLYYTYKNGATTYGTTALAWLDTGSWTGWVGTFDWTIPAHPSFGTKVILSSAANTPPCFVWGTGPMKVMIALECVNVDGTPLLRPMHGWIGTKHVDGAGYAYYDPGEPDLSSGIPTLIPKIDLSGVTACTKPAWKWLTDAPASPIAAVDSCSPLSLKTPALKIPYMYGVPGMPSSLSGTVTE